MKNITKLFLFALCIVLCTQCTTIEHEAIDSESTDYLGQTPPGSTPKVFAPGIISTGIHDMDITISPDLNEIFFTQSVPFDWHASILYLKRTNNIWSEVQMAPFMSEKTRYSYPIFSPDGDKVYFNAKTPINGVEDTRGNNIWLSDRIENGWGPAYPVPGINTDKTEKFPSIASNGNIYFYGNYKEGGRDIDIYCSRLVNNVYQTAENLGASINTNCLEFHPYIAPDESYILFDRRQEDGNFDLFISYRTEDGKWTQAKNLGPTINDKLASDIRPYVSPDGNYLFFSSTRGNRENKPKPNSYEEFKDQILSAGNYSQDMYWVSTQIIEDLKLKAFKDE